MSAPVAPAVPTPFIDHWHSQECKLTPTLTFDLLTSNTDPEPDSGTLLDPDPDRHQNLTTYLSFGHAPHLQKFHRNSFVTCWKMIQDPRKNPDRHQKRWMSRTCHVLILSTCHVWRRYVQRFCVRVLTLTRTHTHTHTRTKPLNALFMPATTSA